jgi:hypothetical protein
MVYTNHWPFQKADKVYFQQFPQNLIPSVNELLHHVQPGLINFFFFGAPLSTTKRLKKNLFLHNYNLKEFFWNIDFTFERQIINQP